MEKLTEKFGVEYLLHFTQCENLENIFKYGLVPRQQLINNTIYSKINDDIRLDGFENASCLSITFPNYKMFYSLRQKNPSIEWAVIGFDRKILWEKECAFCRDNAASNTMTSIDINIRKTKESFCNLFDEYPGQEKRSVLGIDDNMTTNPQAEVLVFDILSTDNIIGVVFNNQLTKSKYEKYLSGNIEVVVNSYFFQGRVDYEFWR